LHDAKWKARRAMGSSQAVKRIPANNARAQITSQPAIRDNVIVTPNAYCIRNGYFGLLKNNLLSSKMASILCVRRTISI
jgi:hypothetical protein